MCWIFVLTDVTCKMFLTSVKVKFEILQYLFLWIAGGLLFIFIYKDNFNPILHEKLDQHILCWRGAEMPHFSLINS